MKKFKAMVALLLCASMLAACSNGGNSSSSSSQGADDASGEKPVLVVSNFALADDRIKDTVIKPFEEKYNCTVVYEGGTNGERLTKLKNDPNTDVDVIYLAQQYAQQGVDAGLFEEIDYSRIPNAEYLLEKADFLKESKQGPAVTMNRLGIIYNPEKAGEITSFADIWKEEYRDQVAIPDISTTFGPAMVAVASNYAGVDYATDGGEAAFKALEELKPNIVKTYSKSSDLKNMFSSGEISVALAAEFAYNTMGDSNTNLVFIDPTEGAYLNFNTVNIVRNSDQKDLAYEFINYVLSEENQLDAALNVPESAVNTQVEIPEEAAKKLTTVETANQSNIVDFSVVNPLLENWVDMWNKTLNQ